MKDVFTPTMKSIAQAGSKLIDFAASGYRGLIWLKDNFLSYDMLATYFVLGLLGALLYVAFAG